MKKVLLTTILLAAGSAVAESALTGIHLGVDAGLQRADFNQYLDTADTGAVPANAHAKLKKPSYQVTGAVTLGYFKDSGDLYYGTKFAVGNVFGDRIKKPTDSTGLYNSIKTKVKQEYSLALTGHIGTYISNDMIFYGLFGVKRIRYALEVNGTAAGAGSSSPRSTVGKTLWGPIVGLGLKRSLSDAWSFQTEVSYEFYQKAKTGRLTATANEYIGMSIQPRLWNLTIGLSHKF